MKRAFHQDTCTLPRGETFAEAETGLRPAGSGNMEMNFLSGTVEKKTFLEPLLHSN